jgi:hypothetical protein
MIFSYTVQINSVLKTIMTDSQIDALDLVGPRFKADIERVARVICERYIAVGTALSWQLLREIEEETLCDLGLLSRWPAEAVAEFADRCEVAPHDGLATADSAAALTGLPRYIWVQFENMREKRPAKGPAQGV